MGYNTALYYATLIGIDVSHDAGVVGWRLLDGREPIHHDPFLIHDHHDYGIDGNFQNLHSDFAYFIRYKCCKADRLLMD